MYARILIQTESFRLLVMIRTSASRYVCLTHQIISTARAGKTPGQVLNRVSGNGEARKIWSNFYQVPSLNQCKKKKDLDIAPVKRSHTLKICQLHCSPRKGSGQQTMTTMSFKFDDSILKLIFLLHSDSPHIDIEVSKSFFSSDWPPLGRGMKFRELLVISTSPHPERFCEPWRSYLQFSVHLSCQISRHVNAI